MIIHIHVYRCAETQVYRYINECAVLFLSTDKKTPESHYPSHWSLQLEMVMMFFLTGANLDGFFKDQILCDSLALLNGSYFFTLLIKGQNYEPVNLRIDHNFYFIRRFFALSFSKSCDISLLKSGPEWINSGIFPVCCSLYTVNTNDNDNDDDDENPYKMSDVVYRAWQVDN